MNQVLYYDVWPGLCLNLMVARVEGHPNNPSYISWSFETLGL